MFRELADARWAAVTANGKQQLMLGRCQPDFLRTMLAPVQEPAEPGAEFQQTGEVLVGDDIRIGDLLSAHKYIVSRYD